MPEGRVPFSEGRVSLIRGARTRLPWDESLFSAERVPVCRVTGPPFPRHGNPCPRDCYIPFPRNEGRSTNGCRPRLRVPSTGVAMYAYPFYGDGYPFIVWRVTGFPMDGYPFPEGRVPHSRWTGLAVPRTGLPFSQGRAPLICGRLHQLRWRASPFPRDVDPITAGLWLLFPKGRGPVSDERGPFSE